ncbi:MAG: hypothetical protein R2705_09420 [Ilumatobacteraceae bacterium]
MCISPRSLDDYVACAIVAGASGFLLKDATADDPLALRAVAAGEAVIAPSLMRTVAEQVRRLAPPHTHPGAGSGRPDRPGTQALRQLAAGRPMRKSPRAPIS